MSKLKHGFAKAFHNYKRKVVMPLSLTIAATTGLVTYNPVDKPEFALDNYSNDITEIQVDYLNKEIDEINSAYSSLQQDLPNIKLQEIEHGEDYATELYFDYNNRMDEIHQKADDFEYKLLSSGMSEFDMKQVITSFNGTDVTNLVDNIDIFNINAVNEALDNINPIGYKQDKDGRSDYVSDLKHEVNNISSNFEEVINEMSTSTINALITFQISTMFLILLAISPEPKKLKEWRMNDPRTRRKKKLSPVNKYPSNKKSL